MKSRQLSLLVISAILITIATMPSLVESKMVRKTLRVQQIKRSNNVVYLTKFAMDIGRGEYKSKIRFDQQVPNSSEALTSIDVQLSVIIDGDWEAFQSEQNCSNVNRRSSQTQNIQIPYDSTFSPVVKGTLTSRRRQHVWFFVLHDCKGALDKIMGNKLMLELEIMNTDKSQYPADEGNFVWYYFLLFLIFTAIFLTKLKLMKERISRSDEFDWPLTLSSICVGLWALSHLLGWLHWLVYGINGQGIFIFDLFSHIASNSCAFVLNVVLVLLSWGWTVNRLKQDFFDTLVPLSIILGVLQIMIVGLGTLTDDSQAKYHQYDGWAGYTVVVFRLALCVYFVIGIKNTLTTSKNNVRPFVKILAVLGMLYFLAFPFLIFTSRFVPQYAQHKLMKHGQILLESMAVLCIHFLFTNKNTAYYKLSQFGSTELPNLKSL